MQKAMRYHDFSAGHRVAGHENKCAHLHGHNYRVTFTVAAARAFELDSVGRVIDFSGIKCIGDWLEKNWDHKFLYWEEDIMVSKMHAEAVEFASALNPRSDEFKLAVQLSSSYVPLSFNPTAECMALHLGTFIAPKCLPADVRCIEVLVEETRKCAASWEMSA